MLQGPFNSLPELVQMLLEHSWNLLGLTLMSMDILQFPFAVPCAIVLVVQEKLLKEGMPPSPLHNISKSYLPLSFYSLQQSSFPNIFHLMFVPFVASVAQLESFGR